MMQWILFSLFLLLPSILMAQDVTLDWTAPTTNVDGTPLTDLDHYEVHQRTFGTSFDFSTPISTVPVGTTTYTVPALTDGHYVFVVLAVKSGGGKSYASNEAGIIISIPAAAPAGVTVSTP